MTIEFVKPKAGSGEKVPVWNLVPLTFSLPSLSFPHSISLPSLFVRSLSWDPIPQIPPAGLGTAGHRMAAFHFAIPGRKGGSGT